MQILFWSYTGHKPAILWLAQSRPFVHWNFDPLHFLEMELHYSWNGGHPSNVVGRRGRRPSNLQDKFCTQISDSISSPPQSTSLVFSWCTIVQLSHDWEMGSIYTSGSTGSKLLFGWPISRLANTTPTWFTWFKDRGTYLGAAGSAPIGSCLN